MLCTFSFPPSTVPTTLAVDPTERLFYVGSAQGVVFQVPLFKRRAELGALAGEVEAVGGGGPGSAPLKAEHGVISLKYVFWPFALLMAVDHP